MLLYEKYYWCVCEVLYKYTYLLFLATAGLLLVWVFFFFHKCSPGLLLSLLVVGRLGGDGVWGEMGELSGDGVWGEMGELSGDGVWWAMGVPGANWVKVPSVME